MFKKNISPSCRGLRPVSTICPVPTRTLWVVRECQAYQALWGSTIQFREKSPGSGCNIVTAESYTIAKVSSAYIPRAHSSPVRVPLCFLFGPTRPFPRISVLCFVILNKEYWDASPTPPLVWSRARCSEKSTRRCLQMLAQCELEAGWNESFLPIS